MKIIKSKKSSNNLWMIGIQSWGEDEDHSLIKLSGFHKFITIDVPNWLVKPKLIKHTGKYKYEENSIREYSVTYMENHVCIRYGNEDHMGDGENSVSWFFPWVEFTFIRHTVYGEDGKVKVSEAINTNVDFEIREKLETIDFEFKDFDDELISVKTYVEEREWTRGIKWCSWLKYFYKNKINRNLDLTFSSEVGKRKGSWKGGTLGHGITITKTETSESAFKRYCVQNNLTFVRRI